ncbi:MAG: hypothetical protein WA484_08895 [Solirubrobacteraceae bacterium]
MRVRGLIVGVLAGLFVLTSGAGEAGAATGYGNVCSLLGTPGFCVPGSFGFPVAVAIDSSKEPATEGDVYVVDLVRGRVFKFNAAGEPASFEATGTNELDGSSTPAKSFSAPAYMATGPSGNIYVENVEAPVIDVFNPKGEYVPEGAGAFVAPSFEGGTYFPLGVGVDQKNGDVYVSDRQDGGVMDIFEEDGTFVRTFPTGAGVSASVAVNSSGDVYVDNEGVSVTEFTATGTPLGTLDAATPQAVGIDPSNQNVFVGENGNSGSYQIAEYAAPAKPGQTPLAVFGNGDFASNGSYGIAVNDKTHHLYVSNAAGENGLIFDEGEGPEAPVTEAASEVTASTAVLNGELNPGSAEGKIGYYFAYRSGSTCTGAGTTARVQTEGNHVKVSTEITGLEPSQHYSFCIFPTNTFGQVEGSTDALTTSGMKPAVDGESFSGPTSTNVTLEAQINPENQNAKYHFQYATSANGETLTNPISLPEGSISAGYGDQIASTDIGGGLSPDSTYYYRVVAENPSGSTEGPVQSFTTIGPPIASIGEAEAPTRSTIILSGSANPVGAATTCHFELVAQAGYQAAIEEEAKDPYASGRRTPPVEIGSDYTLHPIGSVLIGELLPGTTYHFALVANNQEGTTIGADGTFTTATATPPGVETGGASNVAQNTTGISGTVNTQGLATTYGFEIGTSTDYGPPTGLGSVGAGSDEAAVTLSLSGLLPGTLYHYRITATNVDGTSYGADRTFTTSVFASVLVTPPAPLPFLTVPAISLPVEERSTGKATTKRLSRGQKLANALRACKKKPTNKRTACERAAKGRYGPTKRKKR